MANPNEGGSNNKRKRRKKRKSSNVVQQRKKVTKKIKVIPLSDSDEDTKEYECCNMQRMMAPCYACTECDNVIQVDADYYEYFIRNTTTTLSVCATCYRFVFPRSAKHRPGAFASERLQGVPQSEFIHTKNLQDYYEPSVNCRKCGKAYHSTCILFVGDASEFKCQKCQSPEGPSSALSTVTIDKLVRTPLAGYMEASLSRVVPEGKKIYVRVMSTMNTNFELEPSVASFLEEYGIQSDVKYRSRVIYLFEQNTNAPVAFFAIYLQEYEEDSPDANKKTVYISMLDSAKVLSFQCDRSDIFHTAILSYFEYIRTQGFFHVYLWCCPPANKSIEYVFNRRPSSQRLISKTALSKWYHKLTERGQERSVIKKAESLAVHCGTNLKTTTPKEFFKRLPLYKEDHWPNEIKQVLEAVERSMQASRPHPSNLVGLAKYKERQHLKVYNSLKVEMNRQRDYFFKFTLSDNHDVPEIEEPLVLSNFMASRDYVVDFFRENNLEFSDRRKAKYSTACLIKRIISEEPKYECYVCKRPFPCGFASVSQRLNICWDCHLMLGSRNTDYEFMISPQHNVDEDVSMTTPENFPAPNLNIVKNTVRVLTKDGDKSETVHKAMQRILQYLSTTEVTPKMLWDKIRKVLDLPPDDRVVTKYTDMLLYACNDACITISSSERTSVISKIFNSK